jgi:predicted NAD/FAD-dependent oxidoreductase
MAGRELLDEAAMIAGAWMSAPVEFWVHRWRYAHPEGPNAPGGFLKAETASPLYLIGDGLNGGRVEGAWLSGIAAAEDFLISSSH